MMRTVRSASRAIRFSTLRGSHQGVCWRLSQFVDRQRELTPLDGCVVGLREHAHSLELSNHGFRIVARKRARV